MEKLKKEEGRIGKFTRYMEMALVICTTARGPKLANGQDPYGVGQLGASLRPQSVYCVLAIGSFTPGKIRGIV